MATCDLAVPCPASASTAAPLPSAAAPVAELVVAITGCTSGLGLALAMEFMRLGHRVAGCGRRRDRIDELNAAHGASGSAFYAADVSREEDVKAWSEAVFGRFGRVDVLCNNAGMGGAGKLPWDIDASRFGEVLDTNVKGVFHGCKYFIPPMLQDLAANPGRGVVKRVINVSSGLGRSSSPAHADYSASKWAVEALSKSVAQGLHVLRDTATDRSKQVASGQILCVPLAPGVVGSEMNAVSGLPTAEAWSRVAVPFIMSIPVSESGSSLTVPGFYEDEYKASWVIPDGLKLPAARADFT
mmetsp:Transcript_50887/g.143251  ORF Transcript_50887/g.143251 Transcript_50887/m.143251 type:complete len:299 (-) Transcript_50887:20-916(-)